MRDLIPGEMYEFWMCFVVLGEGGWLDPCDAYTAQKTSVARSAVLKLLRWVPEYIRLADRFDWRNDATGD